MVDKEINALLIEKAMLEKLLKIKKKKVRNDSEKKQKSSSKSVLDCESVDAKILEPKNVRSHIIKCMAHISGIEFQNVQKMWVKDHVYHYKAIVSTKIFQFKLELKVKDEYNFEILEMAVKLINIENCFESEMISWINLCVEKNDFNTLISATKGYTDKNIIRAKILDNLIVQKFITIEKCNDENGGITIYVHSRKDKKCTYVKFQWYLNFSVQYMNILHCFKIEAGEKEQFVADHEDLLKQFCRVILDKDEMLNLWQKLCSIIDEEEKIIRNK